MYVTRPCQTFPCAPGSQSPAGWAGRIARRGRFVASALVVLPLCWAPAHGQTTGTLIGTVAALDKTPVPAARVTVVGTELTTVTNVDGAFAVRSVPPGRQTIEIKMIGYATMLLPVEIVAGQVLNVESTLANAPVPLKTVEVRADATARPELRGFEERRTRGAGRFFSRDDISRMQPRLFTDVLRRLPGIQIEPVSGPYGTGYVVQFARSRGVMGSRTCPVLFYINGVPFPVTPDMAINHFIPPEEIAGVEVYASLSDVPAQFNSSMHNARCGVIVVWTYGGERGRRSR